MPDPEIAVIVGAYRRRAYLPAALRSLAEQSVPSSRFELVVTKTFRDPELDASLERSGATVLFDEEPRLGRWLRRAVNASTAPIVTFLDDDDEFEPDRLARVLAAFREHPDLGFYRNRVRVIDGEGRPIPPERWRRHETDGAFDALGTVYFPADRKAGLLEVATRTTTSTFNTSSMAIRRELLDGDVGVAFEETQLEDLFLFVAGALSSGGVLLDPARLTRFRFYGGNVTSTVRWLAEATRSQLEMASLAERHGNPALAEWLTSESVHHQRMFLGSTLMERVRAGADRSEVGRLSGEYLRYLGQHPGERALTLDTWSAGAYGLGYLVAPPLVRRLAVARPTSWKAG